ncbi:hypothetical protein BD626DRAFT_217434 [Schizophyllum amplum]|uniref:Uncharacterized protein n=1 Tax=Schizophyllum amplum TaxID=97359 RepID=A0A550CKS8_9AGAR|nr:hypothetical protein BD626DRAFT_217434 [Auriculariopsis ampla]
MKNQLLVFSEVNELEIFSMNFSSINTLTFAVVHNLVPQHFPTVRVHPMHVPEWVRHMHDLKRVRFEGFCEAVCPGDEQLLVQQVKQLCKKVREVHVCGRDHS